MKALFVGGIKSGKSRHAEAFTLEIAQEKPLYLATTEFFDAEMQERIAKHQEQRADSFETLQEGLLLTQSIQNHKQTVLVECVSMWINNMLYHKRPQQEMLAEIEALLALENNIVFVLNDVSCSVVSEHALVREFVDINGRIAQLLAQKCERVFQTTAGIRVQIK